MSLTYRLNFKICILEHLREKIDTNAEGNPNFNQMERPMKLYAQIGMLLIIGFVAACGNTKSVANNDPETTGITEENRILLPLYNQIVRLPGIRSTGGVPVFAGAVNSVEGTTEPLYVVDGNLIGNSFASVDQVVNAVDVKKIKPIKGPDASFYGSRGSNGVIVITTK